jgi:3',5'-cyclic AMP phosphodiesterase CpdA
VLILHGSDLQVGKPFRPDRADAFLALAAEADPDLVVVSGDLTQRAKRHEYAIVRDFLDALRPIPTVVTPGNHDVPLYRVWERLFAPYRNWRRYVSPELDSVTTLPGATVVALNSSAPRRAIVGGRIDPYQVALARRAFNDAGPDSHRILVAHHHWVPTPSGEGGRPLPHAPRLLAQLEDMGVHLVLGGHVHQTHLTTSRALVSGEAPGIPLVACGTTTSSRGRGPEEGANTLNLIGLHDARTEVSPHRFSDDTHRFEPGEVRVFPMPHAEATPAPGGAP